MAEDNQDWMKPIPKLDISPPKRFHRLTHWFWSWVLQVALGKIEDCNGCWETVQEVKED